jgi:hypothetical protein
MPRIVGDWTRDKLKILEQYLPGYLGATTRALERVYIDGFAGPGLNRLERSGETIKGSPLIALDAHAQNGTAFSRLFFIEYERKNVDELAELVREHPIGSRAQVLHGDVNVQLPRVLSQINVKSPIFLFLDPEGRRSRTSLLYLYLQRLSELGYVHQVEDPRLVRDDGNRNLYYLLFASKVQPARAIMDWVFGQPDSRGQKRLRLDFGDE